MTAYPAGLFKRLIAIAYDLLLLTAVLFIAGVILAMPPTFIFNQGNAITEQHAYYYMYQAYMLIGLLGVSFVFFGWFWTHGGQTLGMKTWRLKLLTQDGNSISWKQAAIRFIAALFSWLLLGLGFISSLFDEEKRCWHDMASKTVLLQLEKK